MAQVSKLSVRHGNLLTSQVRLDGKLRLDVLINQSHRNSFVPADYARLGLVDKSRFPV
jgi:hypothetical protein